MSPNPTRMENNCAKFMAREKLDRVANWVGSSVATAFFASLERCYCITLSTSHDDLEDDGDVFCEEEGKDRRPLLGLTKATAVNSLSSHHPHHT